MNPDRFDLLRQRAGDETVPAAERAALVAVLDDHDEYVRRQPVLQAARVVAVAWDKAAVRVEALNVYGWQVKRRDHRGAELRGSLIVLLDALLDHVREAEGVPDGERLPATERTVRSYRSPRG